MTGHEAIATIQPDLLEAVQQCVAGQTFSTDTCTDLEGPLARVRIIRCPSQEPGRVDLLVSVQPVGPDSTVPETVIEAETKTLRQVLSDPLIHPRVDAGARQELRNLESPRIRLTELKDVAFACVAQPKEVGAPNVPFVGFFDEKGESMICGVPPGRCALDIWAGIIKPTKSIDAPEWFSRKETSHRLIEAFLGKDKEGAWVAWAKANLAGPVQGKMRVEFQVFSGRPDSLPLKFTVPLERSGSRGYKLAGELKRPSHRAREKQQSSDMAAVEKPGSSDMEKPGRSEMASSRTCFSGSSDTKKWAAEGEQGDVRIVFRVVREASPARERS